MDSIKIVEIIERAVELCPCIYNGVYIKIQFQIRDNHNPRRIFIIHNCYNNVAVNRWITRIITILGFNLNRFTLKEFIKDN